MSRSEYVSLLVPVAQLALVGLSEGNGGLGAPFSVGSANDVGVDANVHEPLAVPPASSEPPGPPGGTTLPVPVVPVGGFFGDDEQPASASAKPAPAKRTSAVVPRAFGEGLTTDS
jgi:hypothetical protein